MGSDQETDPQSSDTNLMWNKEGSSREKEEGSSGHQKLHMRGRRGGRRDHPREGWGALAALFKGSHKRRRTLGAIWSGLKREHSKIQPKFLLTNKSL